MYLSIIRLLMIVSLLVGCQANLATKDDNPNLLTIDHLVFSPDGHSLAYKFFSPTEVIPDEYDASLTEIGLWRLKNGKVKKAIKKFKHTIETIFFSPDGKGLALMYSDNNKTNYGFIWHIDRNELSEKQSYMPSYIGPKSIIAISPDKQFTAQPDLKGRIRLWNNITKKIVNTYRFEHITTINAIQFTADNKRLVVVGQYLPPYRYKSSKKNKYQGPTLVASFDLSNKSENIVLDTKSSFLSFHKQSHRLITRKKKTVKIWDSFKQTLTHEIDYIGDMKQMQLSTNGRYLVAIIHSNLILLPDNKPIEMENRHVVIIWDIKTGQPLHVLTDGTRSINSIAISPDNNTLATGGDKGMIRLWNMSNGEMINSLAVSDWEQKRGR